jgi:hypothetical protein
LRSVVSRCRSGVLLLGVAVFGCSGSEAEVGAESAESTARANPTVDEADVTVFLSEYTIDMPLVIDAGERSISVANFGVESHNLLIRDPESREILWQTDGNVEPGQTRESTLALDPGTYMVECTFAGHDTRGMFVRIEVRASRE